VWGTADGLEMQQTLGAFHRYCTSSVYCTALTQCSTHRPLVWADDVDSGMLIDPVVSAL
jgi:hypothetical protein